MELLARLMRRAIEKGVINRDDLNTTEPQVIKKLCDDAKMSDAWRGFCTISRVECFDEPESDGEFLRPVFLRHRKGDPRGASGRRASQLSPELLAQIRGYLALDFSEWMRVS